MGPKISKFSILFYNCSVYKLIMGKKLRKNVDYGRRSEREELDVILSDVEHLRLGLIDRLPPRFTVRDVATAFLASIIIVLTFLFKGSVITISQNLTEKDLLLILISTAVLLTLQIYFIGYTRVTNKKERPFYEFWAKRFFSLYIISILVCVFFSYLYGIHRIIPTTQGYIKFVVALTLPGAVGAAIPSLLKKY